MDWETPAQNLPLDEVDRVELLGLPGRSIIGAEGWPTTFWQQVGERALLSGDDAQKVIQIFRKLEPGQSARCHMPPWGLALYRGQSLLATVSLCYACDNAYVFDARGRDLRAFDAKGENATLLRALLEQHLPISE